MFLVEPEYGCAESEAMALEIEGEELSGGAEKPLTVEDIIPVLECLWERGLDFSILNLQGQDGGGEGIA